MIVLDLLSYKSKLAMTTVQGQTFVKCMIRQKDIVMQREEFVRQLLLHYLLHEKGFPKSRIQVEKGLRVHGLKKRYDILVYSKAVDPLVIIELKSPQVSISQATMEQISAYNLPLQAPYICLSNGMETYFCQLNESKSAYIFLDHIPNYQEL